MGKHYTGRGGTVVYKYDQSWQLIETYRSFYCAYKGEKTSFGKLKYALERGTLFNGHYFKYGRVCRLRTTILGSQSKADFDKGVYFNVEDFARTMLL